MRQMVYNYAAATTTGAALSQAGTSGVPLTLVRQTQDNRNFGVSGVVADNYMTSRSVALASTADVSTVLFTVVGLDSWSVTQTFTITGPNNNTVYSTTGLVTTLLSITPNATYISASGVSAGFGTSGRTDWFVPSTYVPSYNVGIQVTVSGTLNYTVFETLDNLFSVTSTAATYSSKTAALVGASTSQYANETLPVGGYYVGVTGTGTGSLTVTFIDVWV
jgi:hypothetical protein